MWRDWAEGKHRLLYKQCADIAVIDFDLPDDGEIREDGDRGEDKQLVTLALREDGFPLLPTIDPDAPLDHLKRILRAYVREVRSKSDEYNP